MLRKKSAMAINIKNEEVSRVVTELAGELGVSITEAVGQAARDKLAQVRQQSDRRGIADKLLAISKKCRRHASKKWLTWDYDADLYDDRGLPR
jgi:hypothetical protein